MRVNTIKRRFISALIAICLTAVGLVGLLAALSTVSYKTLNAYAMESESEIMEGNLVVEASGELTNAIMIYVKKYTLLFYDSGNIIY